MCDYFCKYTPSPRNVQISAHLRPLSGKFCIFIQFFPLKNIVKADIAPWKDEHGILYLGIRQFLLDYIDDL
ncbi:MAG: hypothetical protein HUK14_04115 [Muribaculaceae bacterium]|mgnify:CR=1 FL=1|nr:hypothetical protein [Muribaculaceae bacterium]